ncbi:MAG: class I SAM-dependent DNA methyltransferase, partial [bacterium]
MKKIDQSQINDVAWRACDTFRGVLDPADYKNYILVMVFLKYISDVWSDHRERYLKEFKADITRVERRLSRERFQLPDGCDFKSLYEHRNKADIGERIDVALGAIEEANKEKLEGVFREVSFNSENKLGQTKDRNARLKHLLEDFNDPRLNLRPSVVGAEDVIGNVYEYLLERFASDAGKKAGEFYTPGQVSTLLARLLAPKKGNTICDPACGSGSLLIKVGRQADERNFALFGQESNGTTHALCRMNMFLHGMDSFRIEWGDTLRNPRLVEHDQLMKFDIVVAKGLVHGWRALMLCLAVLPVLAVPLLLGGVSGVTVLSSALANFSALCWALGAGLLASAFSRTRSQALALAGLFALSAILLQGLATGLFIFGTSLSDQGWSWAEATFRGISLNVLAVMGW